MNGCAKKLAVARARGSRFASIRSVTGELDRVETCEQFLALARQVAIQMLMVYGNQTPPRSRAEMEALATIDGVRSVCIPRGSFPCMRSLSLKSRRSLRRSSRATHNADRTPENSYCVAFCLRHAAMSVVWSLTGKSGLCADIAKPSKMTQMRHRCCGAQHSSQQTMWKDAEERI